MTVLHILVAICVVALVLIQRGKGSDIGASFGSGASQTMFGSQGATPFLVKLTAVLAFVFFITSSLLTVYTGQQVKQASVIPTPAPMVLPFQLPGGSPASSTSNLPGNPLPGSTKPSQTSSSEVAKQPVVVMPQTSAPKDQKN